MVGGGFRVGVCPVSLACLACLACLVRLVCLVCLVRLVCLVCLVRAADSAECAAFAAPEASGLLPGAGEVGGVGTLGAGWCEGVPACVSGC